MATQPRASAPDLPARYYRDNFLTLCKAVETRYADTFSDRESELLAQFRALDGAAQCLYIRLISRVGPWFRLARLNYAEIGPPEAPLQALVTVGLVTAASTLSLEELGRLYTLPELRKTFGAELGLPSGASKSALLLGVQGLPVEEGELLSRVCAVVPGEVIAPLEQAWVERLQLLFFGNLHQGLTDFVLRDLGIARYFPYVMNPEYRLFSCREAIDEYLQFSALAQQYVELREAGDSGGIIELGQTLLHSQTVYASSLQRWHRGCLSVARQLERLEEGELALALYRRCPLHPSRERQARILEAAQQWRQARDLCDEIVAAPWNEAELDAGRTIGRRMLRKLGETSSSKVPDNFARLEVHLPEPPQSSVELATATSLASSWAEVHYVENSLFNTLFALAFWEALFADVAGVFHHPFQAAPADSREPGFRQRREPWVSSRLQELAEGDAGGLLLEAYDRYAGYQCRWADWSRVDRALVECAVQRIPIGHLCAIWERQWFDPVENRSGFPDLIAFGAAAGDYLLIEVKGPGDALQRNQQRWLRYFGAQGIPAAVAWVGWDLG